MPPVPPVQCRAPVLYSTATWAGGSGAGGQPTSQAAQILYYYYGGCSTSTSTSTSTSSRQPWCCVVVLSSRHRHHQQHHRSVMTGSRTSSCRLQTLLHTSINQPVYMDYRQHSADGLCNIVLTVQIKICMCFETWRLESYCSDIVFLFLPRITLITVV